MLPELSSKDRSQRTDETMYREGDKTSSSSLFPVALSLDASPSSSSSSSSLDPSPQLALSGHVEAVTSEAEGSSTSAQIARLFALVGQLQSANEAQLSSSAQLTSTVARLSSENGSLRRTVEDQDRVIGELARSSASGGFWIWESAKDGREEGRWLWSNEKYRSLSANFPLHPGPPTSLDSLPVELVDMIISFLPRSSQLRLARCSFALLARIASIIYRSNHATIKLTSKQAASFVLSRMTDPSETSVRIRSLLLPRTVSLRHAKFVASHLTTLLDVPPHLPRLGLMVVVILSPLFTPSLLQRWSPLLRLVDPCTLVLNSRTPTTAHLPASPTPAPLPKDIMSFTLHWTRLGSFQACGNGSIPLLEGQEKQPFAFSECLLRGAGEGASLKVEVVYTLLDGGREEEEISESEIWGPYPERAPADLARSSKGASVRVSLQVSDGEGEQEGIQVDEQGS